ncbi:MAG: hypothetical protein MJY88_06700 [Bacteroidales bacterium]|nr:hypothetical protein [Bacteroidales bacterium]
MKNLHHLTLAVFVALLLAFSPVSLTAQTSASGPGPSSSDSGKLLLMFWNLENFFDYIDGGTSDSDKEFSAHGTRHWGRKKFQTKCAAIAKTLMWVGGREGRMPDVFAVAEVENRYVLRRLIEDTMIRKYGYEIVHYDSPDPRGIDVALLYRPQTLELLESRPVRVHGTAPSPSVPGSAAAAPEPAVLVTRDILMTKFRLSDQGGDRLLDQGAAVLVAGDTLAVLVNHHPSKYGGGDTDWRRDAALARLKALKDSLVTAGVSKVVATGDFNDTPENTRFQADTLCPFVNLASPLSARGEGSIRFNGRWQLIDMFLVTPPLLGTRTVEMEILHPPFLTVRDNVHSGDKPLRTYSGPRYIGGVSDHRPVILRLGLGPALEPVPDPALSGREGSSANGGPGSVDKKE